VINLAGPSVAESATVASLHQAYLYLPLTSGTAPTWAQLRDLAGFVRHYRQRGAWVYMHDDTGGARAVTTAAMLLLMNGQTWAAMSAQLTPAGLGSQDEQQRVALEELNSALHPVGPKDRQSGNPYAAAQLEPW
jgi:protein-tyrosine phosphatase